MKHQFRFRILSRRRRLQVLYIQFLTSSNIAYAYMSAQGHVEGEGAADQRGPGRHAGQAGGPPDAAASGRGAAGVAAAARGQARLPLQDEVQAGEGEGGQGAQLCSAVTRPPPSSRSPTPTRPPSAAAPGPRPGGGSRRPRSGSTPRSSAPATSRSGRSPDWGPTPPPPWSPRCPAWWPWPGRSPPTLGLSR